MDPDTIEIKTELVKIGQALTDLAESQRKIAASEAAVVAAITPKPPDPLQPRVNELETEVAVLKKKLEMYENPDGDLKNIDVAEFLVGNALAYLRDHCLHPGDRVDIALANLQEVEVCFKRPYEVNKDHTWRDFK